MTDNSDIYDKVHRVLIAGSGPAGLTAAIYAARADLAPLMVAGFESGGQLMDTTDVDNYPGFEQGILGPDLIETMKKQAERFGTIYLEGNIKSVDLSKRPFAIELDSGKSLKAETLLLSTGASARWLGLETETKLRKSGGGVSACATCDGAFFRDKEVAVVGGGDSAVEEATFLTKFASKVTIIHRRDKLRASKIMQKRAFDNPKIEIRWNSVVDDIEEKGGTICGLKLRDTQDQSVSDFPIQGLFMALGHIPNTAFLDGQIETNPEGFILVEDPTTRTSAPGVFACGDVMDPSYKQAITAAGTGCKAAIDAEKFLEDQAD